MGMFLIIIGMFCIGLLAGGLLVSAGYSARIVALTERLASARCDFDGLADRLASVRADFDGMVKDARVWQRAAQFANERVLDVQARTREIKTRVADIRTWLQDTLESLDEIRGEIAGIEKFEVKDDEQDKHF